MLFFVALRMVRVHSGYLHRLLGILWVNTVRYVYIMCAFVVFNSILGVTNFWRELLPHDPEDDQVAQSGGTEPGPEPQSWGEVGGFLRLVRIITGGVLFEILELKHGEQRSGQF